MKRKRGLLYDVLGPKSGRLPQGRGGGAQERVAELRISGGMMLALLALAVALMAGSYYLGTLRGGGRPDPARLSVTTDTRGGTANDAAGGSPSDGRFFTVRVFTFAVPEKEGMAAVEERAWKMADFLSAAGLPHVMPLLHPAAGPGGRSEVVLYAGKSYDRAEVEKLVPRIRRLEYNKKHEFQDAVVTQIWP